MSAVQLTLRYAHGESTFLQGPVRIGRAPDNQLVLQDESLSRHHAEVSLSRGHWVIRDLQSANGLWVAGNRVPSARLQSGDTITLGQVQLVVADAATGAVPRKKRTPFVVLGILASVYFLNAPPHGKENLTTAAPARDASVFLARIPPPPAQLTAEEALQIADRNLKQGLHTGSTLVSARHALAWSAKLNDGNLSPEGETLQSELDGRLAKTFHAGQLAYIRAMKLRRPVEAAAALRLLRETFPTDDPRTVEIDRLEARWK